MSTRVVCSDVLLAAAAAAHGRQELEGAAEDIADAGRTAISGASQFAGDLTEGAAVISLSWSAATRHASRSAATIGAVAEQAVELAEALDASSWERVR